MLKIVDRIFIAFLLGMVIIIALTYLGWVRLLVVKSGSMAPEIPVNSLLLIVPRQSIFNNESVYRTGEVISFKPVGTKAFVTHRIVGVSQRSGQTLYETKGDGNTSNDPKLIPQSSVFGKMVFSLPGLGNLASFLNSFLGLFLIVVLPASLVILYEVLAIQAELKTMKEGVKISKKTLVGPLLVTLFLLSATPVLGLFSGMVILEGNSLSTRETFLADHLVINEVYYQVDASRGLDSPKDRGASGSGNTASNSDTGAGSSNTAQTSSSSSCTIKQSNSSNISTDINVESNTGGNSATGNTGNGSVSSTTASASVSVSNSGNSNQASCGNAGRNDEWVELFNPTDHDISLNDWTLMDNSGKATKIKSSKKIKAGGLALLSKSAATWKFWNENPAVVKIELGQQIGDGLDNAGDHLILKNPVGQTIDALSYGTDTFVFNLPIPLVPLGSSFERKTPGFDTDSAFDFVTRTPPTPGS
jgi:signal peptidase I